MGDGAVLRRERERFAEGVAQFGGIGVALVRAVENDAQLLLVALEKHCRRRWRRFRWSRRSIRQPSEKLRAVLQRRIGEGFREQAIGHACPLVVPQEARQHSRGQRIAGDGSDDVGRFVVRGHRHVHERRRLRALRDPHHRTSRLHLLCACGMRRVEFDDHAGSPGERGELLGLGRQPNCGRQVRDGDGLQVCADVFHRFTIRFAQACLPLRTGNRCTIAVGAGDWRLRSSSAPWPGPRRLRP